MKKWKSDIVAKNALCENSTRAIRKCLFYPGLIGNIKYVTYVRFSSCTNLISRNFHNAVTWLVEQNLNQTWHVTMLDVMLYLFNSNNDVFLSSAFIRLI